MGQQRRVQQGRHLQPTHHQQLLEAFEELVTLHRLKGPALLPKTLLSTDPIQSRLSLVRHSERSIKCIRGSAMLQRWLGTVLLCCDQQFKCVKSFAGIVQVLGTIEAGQIERQPLQTKKRRETTMGAARKISTGLLTTYFRNGHAK